MAWLQSFSRRELGLWLELGVTIYAVVYYLSVAMVNGFATAIMVSAILRIIVVAILIMIIGEILIHIVIRSDEKKDERDQLFEMRGNGAGYAMLSGQIALIIYGLGVAFLQEIKGESFLAALPMLPPQVFATNQSPFIIVHLLFLALTGASMVKLLTILFYYRRGY